MIDANQAESTSCECDNTSAIIGGVVAVAVAFMIITSLTVIVVVMLRSRSGNYSSKTRHDHTLILISNYVIVQSYSWSYKSISGALQVLRGNTCVSLPI